MINLKDKLSKLPKKPGVYVFRSSTGKIIYIGKALSLKNRVSSYFQKGSKDLKTNELVENIADLQTILVNSEFEALLLEAKLIKQHRPKYNIASKDGKNYLYIVIGKEYPNRIYSSRQPQLEEKLLDWYGPFPSGREVQETLKFIRRIFPFRSCAKLPKKVCLYNHLKLCPGVCTLSLRAEAKQSPTQTEIASSSRLSIGTPRNDKETDYQTTITRIRQILSGKITKLIQFLEKEMKSAAKANAFEKASEIKYKIDSLKRLTSGWKSVPKENQDNQKAIDEIKDILIKYGGINLLAINKIEGYDISNLSKQIIVGSMVAFSNGESDKSNYRKFNLKGYFDKSTKKYFSDQDDPLGIKLIISRRLNHPEWIYPQLILIDGGKTQVSAAFSALKEKNLDNQIAVLGLTKEEETIIILKLKNQGIVSYKELKLPRSSSVLKLLQQIRDESHRFAQNYYKKIHLSLIK